MDITMFLNDNMRVLDYLYSKRDDEDFIRVSQQEVAEYFELSRPTINRIFKALKESDSYLFNIEEPTKTIDLGSQHSSQKNEDDLFARKVMGLSTD